MFSTNEITPSTLLSRISMHLLMTSSSSFLMPPILSKDAYASEQADRQSPFSWFLFSMD